MNVLLVNTNRMKPAIAPIGLDYLADAVEAAGHTPRLLDLCFSQNQTRDIEDVIGTFDPDVIGVTIRNTDDCYFNGQAFFLPEIAEVIGFLRRASSAPVVLGGVGFSVAPAAVMEYCDADFGIAGEGEVAFIEFLAAVERGGGFERVPNLIYRDDGKVRRNQRVPVELSELPARRRAFVDSPRYFTRGGQAGFETKRGCLMNCIYCADPVSKGHSIRFMPPVRVVREISALLAQGIDHFHTCDAEFNLPAEHARDVCRALIDAGLGNKIRWYAYCAPKPFDNETAVWFKRAGCAGIDFGVDSGCNQMLRRLGRHFNTEDLRSTAQSCRREQIPFMFDLLLGGPGETRETIRETVEFMRAVDPDCVGLSLGMRVYQGTPMAKLVFAEGDPAANPNLYGAKQNNPHFLKPVFYLSPDPGTDIAGCVRELVGGDSRFFLPEEAESNANYNYNDNTVLVKAIQNGARGAYWDILRRLGKERGD